MAQGSPIVITEKNNNEANNKSTNIVPTISSDTIKGNIKDELQRPFPGVAIKNLTSGKEAISDFDGNFSIEAI